MTLDLDKVRVVWEMHSDKAANDWILSRFAACEIEDPRIATLRTLHKKVEGVATDACQECSRIASHEDPYAEVPWPCPTIQILD